MKSVNRQSVRNDRGMVLIVVLIMLGILTLIVAALVRTGNINFQIAGNQQYRQEARLAAQSAIETYVSNPTNFDTPPTATVSYGLDLDGDGNDEYSAAVPPAIVVGESPVDYLALQQANDPNWKKCTPAEDTGGLTIESGGAVVNPQAAQCANKIYDVNATVTDAATGVSIELHQGIKKLSKLN